MSYYVSHEHVLMKTPLHKCAPLACDPQSNVTKKKCIKSNSVLSQQSFWAIQGVLKVQIADDRVHVVSMIHVENIYTWFDAHGLC